MVKFPNKIFLFALQVLFASCLLGQSSSERAFSKMDLLDSEHEILTTDRLQYRVIEEQSPPVVLSSDSEGKIKFPPLLQAVSVVGKTPYELARELKTLLEVDFFYRATVDLQVAASSYREFVTIYGQVRSQGRVALPQNGFLTASQIISQAGGTIEGADLKNIQIRRRNAENPDKEDLITVDVDSIINQGKVEDDIRLMANDTIIVGAKEGMGGRYSVLGAVNSPGLYTITEEGLTVSEAILLAGGFTDAARQKKVKLTRQIEDSDESEIFWINVSRVLQDGVRSEDMLVKQDDIINVSEKFIQF